MLSSRRDFDLAGQLRLLQSACSHLCVCTLSARKYPKLCLEGVAYFAYVIV